MASSFTTLGILPAALGPGGTGGGGGGTVAVLAASRRIVAIGSSSEARRGVGVDGDSVWMNGARGASYYDIAIKRLAQRGFNINNQAWQGNSNNGPAIVDFIGIDTRFHDQTGAITMSSTRCAGGVPLLFGPTAAEFTVDLDQSVNMIAFYAGCTNVGRAFFVAIDGVEQPSFTLGTSDARYLIDLTQNGLTPGAKRVTFRVKVGTGSVRLQGMEAWTSTTKEIRYISAGSRGWSTSDWSNSTTLASLALLSSVEPFTLFDTMGGNESLTNSADVTAYIARRKSVWDSVKTANAGNTILVGIKPFIGNFDGSSPFQSGSSVTELDVSNAVKAAATTDGYAWFDLTPAAGSFATAQSNGEVRPGTVPHYTRPWHSRVGGGPLGLGDWLISTGLAAAGVSFTGGYAAPAYQPLALGVYMLDAIQGSAYTFTPYKGGGTTGTWSLSAVSPLTINASTGVVTGTPSTIYGETKTTLTFTDADGTVATVGRYIRSIDPATIIWPLDTFDGVAGAALTNAYATNNGGHYTISVGSAAFDTPTGMMWSNALEAGSADQLLYSSDFRLTMKVKAVTVVGGLSAGVAVRGQTATNLNTFEVVIFSATSGIILQHRDGGTVTPLATVAASSFGGWVAGRTYTAIADFRGASATISLSDDAGGSWPNILTFTGEELELYRSQRYWGLRSSGASSATTGWHYDQVKFETLP